MNRIVSKFRRQRVYVGGRQIDQVEYWWLVYIKPVIKRTFSVIFLIYSVILVALEVSLFLNISKVDMRGLLENQSQLVTQLTVTFPMVFMFFTITYGLFRLKINGLFGLYDNNQTDGPSLIFAAVNFSRIGYPLSFNYLQLIDINNTSFNNLFG